MKFLTIVIPCYNVEQYLAECLDSILDTKYNDVLEVLAINDGSKDGTLALAREYEVRFPEILRVIDKPNGGWGTVINMAIAEARGRYFKILDSDDWFDKVIFDEFITSLRTCDADIFVSNYTIINKNEKIIGPQYEDRFLNLKLDMNEYSISANGNIYLPMTNITIRKCLLVENQLKLPPRYYGDIYYLLFIIANSKSIYITNLNLYQYRKDVQGQSTSIVSYKRNYKDYITLAKSLIVLYGQVSLSEALDNILKDNILRVISFSYKLLMSREYCVDFSGSHDILHDFNKFLKQTSSVLYRASFKITNKHIPYVLIWRLFNINLFKLR